MEIKIFKPRIYFWNLWLIYVVFGSFFAIGLTFLSGVMNGIGKTNALSPIPFLSSEQFFPGLVFTLFAGFALMLLLIFNLGIGSSYGVSLLGIHIQKNFRKKLIPAGEIHSIQFISQDAARELLQSRLSEGQKQFFALDFSGYRNYTELHRYLSVPVSESRHGRSVAATVDVHGDMVLVELKDGTQHLLSPDDPQDFIAYASGVLASQPKFTSA
jgi:hypothetical protein